MPVSDTHSLSAASRASAGDTVAAASSVRKVRLTGVARSQASASTAFASTRSSGVGSPCGASGGAPVSPPVEPPPLSPTPDGSVAPSCSPELSSAPARALALESGPLRPESAVDDGGASPR